MDAGKTTSELPVEVEAYIDEVAQRIRGRKTREQVRRELAARFTEALADCPTPQERQARGAALLVSWGEAPQVARRIRWDRKRARPLWKKALIRTAQVMAIWLTVVGIRYLSLSVGSPEVRVDYLQMLEELNRQGHPPEDNAYPYYQEAWEIIAAAASDMVEQIRQEKAAQSGDAQEEDQDEWQPRFTIIGPDGKPQDVPVQMPDHFKAMVREPDLFMELDGFLESFWSDSLTDFEKQAWAQFLVDAEPGFQRLIEGTEKPYCWPPENKEDIRDEHNALSADNDELLWERGPSAEALRNVRFLAQLMTIRARWRCCYGEIADGFADLMTVYRLSGHFSGQRFVGEQLLGVGIQRFASTAMLDVLSRLDVSQEVLTEASNELALFLNRFVYAISFEAERFVMLDFVQRTFTDRDKGRGRPLKDGIPLTILTKSDYWKSLLLTGFRSRQSVVRDIDQLFDLLQEISRFGSEPNVYGVLVNAEIEEIYDKSILLSILGPPWQKSIEVVWMNRMLSQGVYTIMALERYHAAHGEYPESLEALLAAGYITTLPRDFYADGSLKYRRANDSFTLYSIGPNVRDDGGWQNPVSEWGYDREGGDRVFWPLPRRSQRCGPADNQRLRPGQGQ